MTQQHPNDMDSIAAESAGQPEQPAEAVAAADAAAAAEATLVDERIAALEAEAKQAKDQALRALAELENTRRRLEAQAEDRARFAVTNFARDVLNVADNLRRALDAMPAEARETDELARGLLSGVEMTERELMNTFERYGIKQVPAEGQRFDPNLHQAMMEVEDPSRPAGMVAMVMQQGYVLHERLLRPAMVAVTKGGPKLQAGENGGVDTTA